MGKPGFALATSLPAALILALLFVGNEGGAVGPSPPSPSSRTVSPSPESAPAPEIPDGSPKRAAPPVRSGVEVPEPAPDAPVALRLRLTNAETGELLPGGSARVVPGWNDEMPVLTRGDTESVRLEVRAPPGFTMEDPERFEFDVTVSRYTREVVATVPVWPEARLVAVVTEEDGSPAAGAAIEPVRFEGTMREVPAAMTDRFGRAAVRGLPAIPGERVVVAATKDHRTGTAEPVVLARTTTEVLAFVTLPPEPNEFRAYRGPAGSVPV